VAGRASRVDRGGLDPGAPDSAGSLASDEFASGDASRRSAKAPRVEGIRRIVLTGFMGAGKSTVGQMLADRLRWRFIDVDHEIEASENATIAAIFTERGEPWFRQMEHETIQRHLTSERVVLALGGGAIEHDRTRGLILRAGDTCLIHLEVSLETVLLRCGGTEDLRPVLRDRLNLESRYALRLPLYRQAHLNIAVDSLPPDAVVTAVLAQIDIRQ
jgi:shikimate kinase